jgi:hypothetical protein
LCAPSTLEDESGIGMDGREEERPDDARTAKCRLTLVSYISPMLRREVGSAAPLGEQIGCSSQGILLWEDFGAQNYDYALDGGGVYGVR